jgi:hypothetical protein
MYEIILLFLTDFPCENDDDDEFSYKNQEDRSH